MNRKITESTKPGMMTKQEAEETHAQLKMLLNARKQSTRRWILARAFKFINQKADTNTTIETLINHCLGTPGFYYTCSVGGFDISIKACPRLASEIKELRQQASVKNCSGDRADSSSQSPIIILIPRDFQA